LAQIGIREEARVRKKRKKGVQEGENGGGLWGNMIRWGKAELKKKDRSEANGRKKTGGIK